MSQATHLLLSHACALDHEGRPLWPSPAARDLPNLAALLRQLREVDAIEAGADSPSMPHELVRARLLGLPAQPGRIPWAAWETGTANTPCGWIRPCHLQVGADQVLLAPGAQLSLDETASRALFDAAAPFLSEDGIALRFVAPDAWLATGEPLRDLPTWSMDRLTGRHLTPKVLHFSGHPHAALWQRLHNEMQMLFYAHPVNDRRAEQRLPLINAIWVSGAGMLDTIPSAMNAVDEEHGLRESALALDAQTYAQTWRRIDASTIAPLLDRLRAGEQARLTLAGERRAVTYEAATGGLAARLTGLFAKRPSLAVLDTL